MANSITCIINNDLQIRLENVKEVYGHDDSLPFNADVFVYDRKDESGCFHKIAIAYNDGWGGNSVIEPTMAKYQIQLNDIDNYLKENYEIKATPHITFDVTLEYVISSMACFALSSKNSLRIKIETLDAEPKKK